MVMTTFAIVYYPNMPLKDKILMQMRSVEVLHCSILDINLFLTFESLTAVTVFSKSDNDTEKD